MWAVVLKRGAIRWRGSKRTPDGFVRYIARSGHRRLGKVTRSCLAKELRRGKTFSTRRNMVEGLNIIWWSRKAAGFRNCRRRRSVCRHFRRRTAKDRSVVRRSVDQSIEEQMQNQ